MALSTPDGRLHLTMLEVGSGKVLLVQTPAGRNLLVDTGLQASRHSDSLGRRLPLLRRELDWLVVAGYTLLRTDRNWWIEVGTDRGRM